MTNEPYLAIRVVMMPRDTNPLRVDFWRRHPEPYRFGGGDWGAARGGEGAGAAAIPGDGGHEPRGIQAAGAGRRRRQLQDDAW